MAAIQDYETRLGAILAEPWPLAAGKRNDALLASITRQRRAGNWSAVASSIAVREGEHVEAGQPGEFVTYAYDADGLPRQPARRAAVCRSRLPGSRQLRRVRAGRQ